MTIKTILLSGALALAAVTSSGVLAQTAKDYARYSTYTAPRAQGQNVNGMHVFIFGGLKSHGPGAHGYPYFMDTWSKLLTAHGAVVDGAFSFPSQEQLDHSDVVIIYKGDAGYMTPEQRARLQSYVKRGGGLVTFHDSLCGPDPADMATLVGAGMKHGEVNYTWTATLDYNVVDKENPIAQGMPGQIYDEAFYKLNFATMSRRRPARPAPSNRRVHLPVRSEQIQGACDEGIVERRRRVRRLGLGFGRGNSCRRRGLDRRQRLAGQRP